jgi:hypothetical protein
MESRRNLRNLSGFGRRGVARPELLTNSGSGQMTVFVNGRRQEQGAESRGKKAIGKKADGRRQTAGGRRQEADGRRQTAGGRSRRQSVNAANLLPADCSCLLY